MKFPFITEAELSKSDNSLSHTRVKSGVVSFFKTSLQDEHIKRGIKICAEWFEVDESVVEAQIAKKVVESKKYFEGSPKLFAQIADNQVESALFQIFWDYQIPVPGAFSIKSHTVAFKRFTMMMVNSLRMRFGLDKDRGYLKQRPLKSPGIFHYSRLDGPEYKEGERVSTAYCKGTTGSYHFDMEFSQALLNFGKLKGIKPFGKIFKNRGGIVPDEFGYLETVIFHEFMHYYHDDTEYYNIKQGCSHSIMNWASDFRSNYLLAKSGFVQLPIGLYSDSINFDRQMSLDEMYETVKTELENHQMNNMEVGDVVVHPDGSLGQITSINGDAIETNPVSKEQADKIIDERDIKRMVKQSEEQADDPLLVHAVYNKKPFNISTPTPNQLNNVVSSIMQTKYGEFK